MYRGERRGCNEMFYPKKNHGIEDEYIIPIMRSSKEVTRYITTPTSEAFICGISEEELRKKNHTGALNWIAKFKGRKKEINNEYIPFPDNLKKSAKKGDFWYQMRANKLADFILPLNPGDRIFISKISEPSFVDQRLTCLTSKEGIDKDLFHALLNTAISMFMIEGMGFGRGGRSS